jgi:hypothetical protein
MPVTLPESLEMMGTLYRLDPVKAVRGQGFIKILHVYLMDELDKRLTPWARRRGIEVRAEVKILGSHKPKDVDVAVMDPDNGPLMLIGVRSQMSSVGKNQANYYESIVGECISLQDRFPMCAFGYVYLMPKRPIKLGLESESIDHARYARMYAAVTGRGGPDYKNLRGIYDEFAYMVVDFDSLPPALADDTYNTVVRDDLSIDTFVDRFVAKFNDRFLFWDVFKERSDATGANRVAPVGEHGDTLPDQLNFGDA